MRSTWSHSNLIAGDLIETLWSLRASNYCISHLQNLVKQSHQVPPKDYHTNLAQGFATIYIGSFRVWPCKRFLAPDVCEEYSGMVSHTNHTNSHQSRAHHSPPSPSEAASTVQYCMLLHRSRRAPDEFAWRIGGRSCEGADFSWLSSKVSRTLTWEERPIIVYTGLVVALGILVLCIQGLQALGWKIRK